MKDEKLIVGVIIGIIIIGLGIVAIVLFALFGFSIFSNSSSSSSSSSPVKPIVSTTTKSCALAGCSKELCVESGTESNIATDCLYQPQYACYKENFAICKQQEDGKCGWTQTNGLIECLKNKK